MNNKIIRAAAKITLASVVFFSSAILSGSFFGDAGRVQAQQTETAILAGGCFWCTEADFDKLEGVKETVSGYIGGEIENPDYKSVSAGTTGHTEAVRIVFDPTVIDYASLLEYYWKTIDPTVDDRQFCDRGSQYRPEIFVTDDKQADIALASREAISKSKPFDEPIKVAITAATTFYPAEDYHQDYHNKNPIRYNYYRKGCRRDKRLKQLWG